MNQQGKELLFDKIGEIEEGYIREYVEEKERETRGMEGGTLKKRKARGGKRFSLALAAAAAALLGTVSFAAVPAIGHFLESWQNERHAVVKNFDQIEAEYGVDLDIVQECDGVVCTWNSAVVEERFLVLNCTFDWSGLEEAQNGSFHTWYLPWSFRLEADGRAVAGSENTEGLHTQSYHKEGAALSDFSDTYLYCIDLGDTDGRSLVGKELTVRLTYGEEGDGFGAVFTPNACYEDRSWLIDKSYELGERELVLKEVRESALYVTVLLDCDFAGNTEGYTLVLSDELGGDYALYPYDENEEEGYWFTKPEQMGEKLVLKVVRSRVERDVYGNIIDDSYEVLYEIPVELGMQ